MIEAALSGKKQGARGVNTLLLLQASKGFSDQATPGRIVGKYLTCNTDAAQSKFGGLSFNCLNGGIHIDAAQKTDLVFDIANPYTIEFWCYNTSLANVWWIYSGQPYYSDLKIYSGYVYVQDQGGSLNAPSSFMVTGKWSHVAITSDGTKVRFFVDGKLIGVPFAPKGWSLASYFLRFGTGEINSAAYLDQIRVSKIARYTAAFTPPTTEFVVD